MIGSWFKSGEQVSPSSPTLALLGLLHEDRTAPDWEQERGKFIAACAYIYRERGTIFSSYFSAEKCIEAFIANFLPSWKLSTRAPEVCVAYVWAIARVVSVPSAQSGVASQLLDKLVTNGAQVSALAAKLAPTGIRKLLGPSASKIQGMEQAIANKTTFDRADSMEFLNDQFLHLRPTSYLSWHSGVDPLLRAKFPGVVAYKNMCAKL